MTETMHPFVRRKGSTSRIHRTSVEDRRGVQTLCDRYFPAESVAELLGDRQARSYDRCPACERLFARDTADRI